MCIIKFVSQRKDLNRVNYLTPNVTQKMKQTVRQKLIRWQANLVIRQMRKCLTVNFSNSTKRELSINSLNENNNDEKKKIKKIHFEDVDEVIDESVRKKIVRRRSSSN